MTNKPVLRSVEQFMSGYVPTYKAIYPLFMKKKQQYAAEAGKLDFRRVDTIGDIRAKVLTPKDTEMKQIAVSEGTKSYKKYFFANQYVQSFLQDTQGIEDVAAQVLDEHQKQMDSLFLTGDGTANNNVLNNGLYFSGDSNYRTENSVTVALASRLYSLHTKVAATAALADRIAGEKVILFYGTDILPLFDSIYDTAVKPFKVALKEVLGENYSMIKLPSDVTPSGANGWLIANLDQIKTHYTVLPRLDDQGENNEKKYIWQNFMMGSAMVEVLADDAIIRQPATLET